MLDHPVAEYATANGDWDWERISQVLPNDCLDFFMPIKATVESAGSDRVAWFPVILGDFSLKLAYKYLSEGDLSSQAQVYKEIWRFNTPQKVEGLFVCGGKRCFINQSCPFSDRISSS